MIPTTIKTVGFCLYITLFLLVSFTADLFLRNPLHRRKVCLRITSLAAKLGLKLFNIRVSVKGKDKLSSLPQPCLVIANHLSYLDILIIASCLPSLFITSIELKKTFFLGLVSRMGGSLFVERRSKTKLLQEIENVAAVIKSGINVVLFPEGTSSNGDSVLPFKAALFSSATSAQVAVQPLCIKYHAIDDKPIDADNRDLAYYYGHLQFFPHLLKLLTLKSIDVQLTVLDSFTPGAMTRKEIADRARAAIMECYH